MKWLKISLDEFFDNEKCMHAYMYGLRISFGHYCVVYILCSNIQHCASSYIKRVVLVHQVTEIYICFMWPYPHTLHLFVLQVRIPGLSLSVLL